MSYTTDLTASMEMIKKRGPRYAISYNGGPGRAYHVDYRDTAEQAEAQFERIWNEGGWRNVRLHKPVGLTDLRQYAEDRSKAKAVFDEATSVLRAAVIRAVNIEGRAEAEVAREAHVDRMTIRAWLGKR